jgi:hypothetical protein
MVKRTKVVGILADRGLKNMNIFGVVSISVKASA